MKFVHAADLHIDSPLRGLEAYEGAPVERVRRATRAALENVVQLCLDEQVDFLVSAGDLFDYDWRDFNTALFVVQKFQLLEREGIPVYLIRGNHDSREEMTRKVPWPKNVTLFDHRRPQTVRLENLGVALHGMSFPTREVTSNLVPSYPAASSGLFNIGLLHTNANGSLAHESYAPCRVEELVDKRYDYWALGHVHQFSVLHQDPYVVYSGNTQGRHVREEGVKGCAVVTVTGDRVQRVDFRPTDVLRWFNVTVSLRDGDTLDDMYVQTKERLEKTLDAAEGRLTAVRLTVEGTCAAHRQLADGIGRQEAIAELRSLPFQFTDDLWIEKIRIRTRPELDRQALARGQDLLGDLLRSIDGAAADESHLKELAGLLQPVLEKTREYTEGELDLADSQQWRAWLAEAESTLLNLLTHESA